MANNSKPKFSLLDYLCWPFFALFFLLILIVFEPIQRSANIFGRKTHAKSVVQLNRALFYLLRFFGVKIQIDKIPALETNRPYIVISNHQSLFDMPIISEIFHKHYPRYIAKKELTHGFPSVSYNLKNGGHALIDRQDRKQAIKVIKQFAESLADEKVLGVIFPEGTRAKDGKLKEFKTTGSNMLLRSIKDADVIPLAIDGTWKLSTRKFGLFHRGTEVSVHIGQLLNRGEQTDEELLLKAQEFIRESLEKQ